MTEFTAPSVEIDAAICDLLAAISNFSDPDFDAEFVELQEEEIEQMIMQMIEAIRMNLTGKILAFYLETIRQME